MMIRQDDPAGEERGRRLQQRRERLTGRRGGVLTQVEVAAALDVSESTVGNMEAGRGGRRNLDRYESFLTNREEREAAERAARADAYVRAESERPGGVAPPPGSTQITVTATDSQGHPATITVTLARDASPDTLPLAIARLLRDAEILTGE